MRCFAQEPRSLWDLVVKNPSSRLEFRCNFRLVLDSFHHISSSWVLFYSNTPFARFLPVLFFPPPRPQFDLVTSVSRNSHLSESLPKSPWRTLKVFNSASYNGSLVFCCRRGSMYSHDARWRRSRMGCWCEGGGSHQVFNCCKVLVVSVSLTDLFNYHSAM